MSKEHNEVKQTKSMSSIARKLHGQMVRKKLGVFFGADVLLFFGMSFMWLLAAEAAAVGSGGTGTSKLIDFEKELYKDYFDKPGVRNISFEEYQILCNKYIHQAKIDKKLASVGFFFCLYNDYQVPYKHFADYFKPATKAEIKQAKKDFGHVKEEFNGEIMEHNHTFSEDADVLDYRGLRLIIDDEWGDAWIKDENGEIHHFQLIWDWDYPIDEYIAYHII